jgi:hypothetical protein
VSICRRIVPAFVSSLEYIHLHSRIYTKKHTNSEMLMNRLCFVHVVRFMRKPPKFSTERTYSTSIAEAVFESRLRFSAATVEPFSGLRIYFSLTNTAVHPASDTPSPMMKSNPSRRLRKSDVGSCSCHCKSLFVTSNARQQVLHACVVPFAEVLCCPWISVSYQLAIFFRRRILGILGAPVQMAPLRLLTISSTMFYNRCKRYVTCSGSPLDQRQPMNAGPMI